jgi:SAM-dependent methyltransferase
VDAVDWLVGEEPRRVLELGAGTGKLTRTLVELGHDVLATDPDAAMLEVLDREVPGVPSLVGSAEDLDVPSQTVDAVVVAEAFHWFDPERALPEIARVLRPGGHLALVWNEWDQRVPWVKRLARLLGLPSEVRDPSDVLLGSELFLDVEHATHKHRQHLDQHTIVDLARSCGSVATLEPEQREQVLADVLAFYEDYGRGMDGMLLPYFAHTWRADVVEIEIDEPEPAPAADSTERDEMTDTIPRELRGQVRPARPTDLPGRDLDDSQMILIDFR